MWHIYESKNESKKGTDKVKFRFDFEIFADLIRLDLPLKPLNLL